MLIRTLVLSGIYLEPFTGGVLNGRNSDFRNANLESCVLKGIDLCGSSFQSADLNKADLCNSRLFDVDFKDASLSGAQLCGAELPSPENFVAADLSRVNLTGARTSRSDFLSAIAKVSREFNPEVWSIQENSDYGGGIKRNARDVGIVSKDNFGIGDYEIIRQKSPGIDSEESTKPISSLTVSRIWPVGNELFYQSRDVPSDRF
jgi:hypothetical protein